MAEGDRLRGLQMGEARHHRTRMVERLGGERQLKRAKRAVERADLVPHIELEIGRHLVVARARGMELAGHRPDQLAQPALDIEMNVLERARESELAGLDLGQDLVEAARDLVGLRRFHDAGRAEHGDMRLGGKNVVTPQPLVEVDGGVYLLHDLRRTCGKAAAPHGVGHRCRAWARRGEREDVSKRNERKRAAPPAIYLVAALVAAIAGFGTVYVSFAPSDNGETENSESGPGGQGTGARARSPASTRARWRPWW